MCADLLNRMCLPATDEGGGFPIQGAESLYNEIHSSCVLETDA